MAQDDDGRPPRKGSLSAFALLKSWLFDKAEPAPAHNETEFLNTRDGYELARFAEKAFGGDAEAKKAHQAAVEAEQFEVAMSALSTLRAPIDAFFEGVMVNDPDPHKRAYRIGLLERFVSAVHRVADFSKIEG